MSIGIFGGTFDPFHKGHISILNDFILKCDLSLCYVVPNKCSPFKNRSNLFSDKERINIIERKIRSIPKAKLSLFEIQKDRTSYTIDTLIHFQIIHSNDKLFLLIGSDVANEFCK